MANVQKPEFKPPVKSGKKAAKGNDQATKGQRQYTSTPRSTDNPYAPKPASPNDSRVKKPVLSPQEDAAKKKRDKQNREIKNPASPANENKYANPYPKPASPQKKGIMNRLRRGK